ncbi:MAG: LysR family transcriptional regulator [Chloroflexi bacterium]|nr:LysR family transcriptional regulator [Chloroflexota bacterium]
MATRKIAAVTDTDKQTESSVPFPNVSDLEPRSKFWIERNGEVAISEWRLMLLEGIDRTGSLTKAAEEMKVPYRTAWQRLKESEERLGVRLVETQSGGAEGGGSSLTDTARALLRRYHQFSDGLEELVDRRFREAFD